MQPRQLVILASSVALLVACEKPKDPAADDFGLCEFTEQKGDLGEAKRYCEHAVSAAPTSPSGKAAAEKLKAMGPRYAKWKADQDAAAQKAAADKKAAEDKAVREAAAKKAAQDAEDARCTKWVTICTIGRWPDGSEKTTGRQTFKTKSDCTSAGDAFGGIPCDPCRCND
jgi:membrane protein involved in colicin uptake